MMEDTLYKEASRLCNWILFPFKINGASSIVGLEYVCVDGTENARTY